MANSIEYIKQMWERIHAEETKRDSLIAENRQMNMLWVGVPNRPTEIDDEFDSFQRMIEGRNQMIAELRAHVEPYCLAAVERLGITFYNALIKTLPNLNYQTQLVEVPPEHITFSGGYRYAMPNNHQLFDSDPIPARVPKTREIDVEFQRFRVGQSHTRTDRSGEDRYVQDEMLAYNEEHNLLFVVIKR